MARFVLHAGRKLDARGAKMDWRLISAVTLAGASFSMVAFGAYTLRAADAPDADRGASPLSAPALMPVDAARAAGGQHLAVRGVTFMPVEGNGVAATAPAEGTSVFAADLPVMSREQGKGVKVSWNHRRHGAWRVSHHVTFCTALRRCEEKRLQQVQVQQQVAAVPVRHEEQRSTPKIALMLGVGF
jgi:hypothetical protein